MIDTSASVEQIAKQLRDSCSTKAGERRKSLIDLRALFQASHYDPMEYINIGNSNGKTAIHFAAQYRDDGIVQWLVGLRADVNAMTTQGQTALIFACCRGHVDTVEFLLEAGARCRVRTATGSTALGLCTSGGLPEECVQAIREAEEQEKGDWADFTLEAKAVDALAAHLQRNPRLEKTVHVPISVEEALFEQKQQAKLVGTKSRQRAAAIEGVDPLPLELPKAFQAEHLLVYDTKACSFVECIKEILQEEGDLARLHHTCEGQRILAKFAQSPSATQLGPRDNLWNQRFHSARRSKDASHMHQFQTVIHKFLQNYVLPDLGTKRIAYQVDATFRCHLPCTGAVGRPHRDEDYGHPWSEVNYWIPLTKVWGSNSLTSESSCGLGDYHAFSADVGQAVRFWGNQVWHYTCANDTDSTRVSFDLRVIREEEWSPASFSYFRIGEYYSILAEDGPVSPEVLSQLKQQYNGAGPVKSKKSGSKKNSHALIAQPHE